jgi:hypothetical protein
VSEPDAFDESAEPVETNDLTRQREQVIHLVKHAGEGWATAMRAHTMAPPDEGFATRLRSLAEAAAREQVAWEQAHRAGMMWRPVPGAERAEPPYELRPGTGRRGPEPLWGVFDQAVGGLNRAIGGSSAEDLATAFGAMARAASDLADAVEREDEVAREAYARAHTRGVA